MKGGILDKLTKTTIVLVLLAIVAGVLVLYKPLLAQEERLRQQAYNLEAQIVREVALSNFYHCGIQALDDPRTVERRAREVLSLAKAGETVIRFESPPASAPPPASKR